MTCGYGTKQIPKDYKFENMLKIKMTSEKFENILYYDACIIVNPNKAYGKIIIGDDCVYSYLENEKLFSVLAEFKDIISINLLDDDPDFILGPMRNDCIHIRLEFYKRKPSLVKNKDKQGSTHPVCCRTAVREENDEPLLNTTHISAEVAPSEGKSEFNQSMVNQTTQTSIFEISIKFVDFYILNKYSPAFYLLKKAHLDYVIYHTLTCSFGPNLWNYSLTQTLINDLFEGLIFDISTSKDVVDTHRRFLLELIQSGNKYKRIQVLFWSKPDLYNFMVELFLERSNALFGLDNITKEENGLFPESTKQLIYTSLDSVNVLLMVFNIFFFQTDHLYLKWKQLRKYNGLSSISLIRNMLKVVAYLNRHDCNDIPASETTPLDIDIDNTKYEITINSIQLLYYLISSSQVPFNDEEFDPFSMSSICILIESLISYDSNEAIFNSFINQVMRMIFIWLYPDIYKFEKPIQLSPQQVVTIFQLFTSLRALVHRVPKIIEVMRREMREEFHYFIHHEITFSDEYPLSQLTLSLLRVFQKNMTNSNEIFSD